jgi:hypothetical protein
VPISLQGAIDDLYRKAVVLKLKTSTQRLQRLADYCVERLDERGLRGAEAEVLLQGAGRPKFWDVGWRRGEEYSLAISLKSILRNLSGTVPNRIDDLMGEAANVQLVSPEIVIGYIMVFDTAEDPRRTWVETLSRGLQNLARGSGRDAGRVEAAVIVEVNFLAGARVLTPEAAVLQMLDFLVAEVRARNPGP